MNAQIFRFSDSDIFWEKAREPFLSGKKLRVALSGGSAADIIDAWQKAALDTSKWEFFQTDERFVSSDHPENNARLFREKLKDSSGKQFFFPVLNTPKASIASYEEQLSLDEDGYFFDVTVLGMGPDGHTASLFPDSTVLDESKKLTAVTYTDQFAVRKRMTLTFPAIQRSRTILVLVRGQEKKEVFTRCTDPQTDFHQYPARKILDYPDAIFCYLDS
ncbi:6-phosphogluconolactonase [Candidatus Gracilibacteria bacterium]|nr:6-phosphogluconolactonase [Candidatus Gracilibacteria bacterium]MCF7819327.1 6-phosphogluconolactonase [Candidatus Gracilibacteria bacterium]